MLSRRMFVLGLAATGGLATVVAPSFAQGRSPAAATAITQVFGNGLRFVAVAIAYPEAIRSDDLSVDTFEVAGRTVVDVYAATSPDPAHRTELGKYVIVSLSPEDDGASLAVEAPQQGQKPTGRGGPGKAGESSVADTAWVKPEGSVVLPAIATVDGTEMAAAEIGTTAVHDLIVDDFQQLEYVDPHTGDRLGYNLYVPRDYDPEKTYPLVNFMHDAGATSAETRTTLLQGLGAISWASPADQAVRPCFVLAPQYAEIIADDDSNTSSMLDTTINLITSLTEKYNIDKGRIYTTGQSGGGMMSIAMNIKYPDFFAASFLVACQWDPALVAPMAKNRLFILVSQDDGKAFPGQNAITQALEADGAQVARAVWDGRWTDDQFRFAFDDLNAEGARINYVTFAAGTVIPEGESTAGASGHRNTWRLAYSIEPIREWLLLEGS
ncbi:MAG: peptidase [Kaistia sp. SCN 65-12]|nr:MAG: peptidase [Kaistia sp. SCN 65-12]